MNRNGTRTASRPLGATALAELSSEKLAMLARLDQAQFPYVHERLLKDGNLVEGEIDEAIFELKRYLALKNLTQQPLEMLSPVVDEVWHQFILFTKSYMEFCQDVFGAYIHHTPATSFSPLGQGAAQNTVELYEYYFGPLTRLWIEGQQASSFAQPTLRAVAQA